MWYAWQTHRSYRRDVASCAPLPPPGSAGSPPCRRPPPTPPHRPTRPNCRGGLVPYRSPYVNWAGEITHHGLWACAPRTGQEVADLANWAHASGWRLRARGMSHTWCPLTITRATASDARVLLLDTTEHLTRMGLAEPPPGAPGAVRAQTGVLLDTLLGFLADHGLGVTNTPAPGELSLGGALAIDAHGASVPADGETARPGHTYGSLSNLVLSLTAVVWDAGLGAYVLRTFRRGRDPECEALAAHLGRAFVVVALRALLTRRQHTARPPSAAPTASPYWKTAASPSTAPGTN